MDGRTDDKLCVPSLAGGLSFREGFYSMCPGPDPDRGGSILGLPTAATQKQCFMEK